MNAHLPQLSDGEERLTNRKEKLFRQIHPSYFYNDQATIQVFYPTRSDNGELSVSRGAILTAYGAFLLRQRMLKKTVGSLSVSVKAIEDSNSQAVDDSLTDPDLPIGHAYIDFRAAADKSAKKHLAQTLLDRSSIAYPCEDNEEDDEEA